MDKKNFKFDDTENEEYKLNDLDINEIVVSNKLPFGKQDFKYFFGCKDNKEIRLLCIFFAEMSRYKRYSDGTKCMYFLIKDVKLFDKYVAIWEIYNNINNIAI